MSGCGSIKSLIYLAFLQDRIRILKDKKISNHNQYCVSGPGSRRAKITQKNRKKIIIFIFLSAGCSLLRAEGFFCSLDFLYGGLGISNCKLSFKKR
jgi:hypothetical protein